MKRNIDRSSGKKMLFGALLGLGCALATLSSAGEIAPLRGFHSLVAGGDRGFEDGDFAKARFDHPQGLLFDEARDRLLVADSGNSKIRAIELENKNQVSTLALPGALGTVPPLSPTALVWDQVGSSFYVYDAARGRLGWVDLDAGRSCWNGDPSKVEGASDLARSLEGAVVAAFHAQRRLLLAKRQGLTLTAMASVPFSTAGPEGLDSLVFQGMSLYGLARGQERSKVFEIRLLNGPAGVTGTTALNWNALPGNDAAWADFSLEFIPVEVQEQKKPWALVKQSSILSATGWDPIFLWMERSGVYGAVSPEGHLLGGQIGKPEAGSGAPGAAPVPLDTEAKLQGNRLLLAEPSAAVLDAKTLTWYVVQSQDHRVVSFRQNLKPESFWQDQDPPSTEWTRPTTRRLVTVGNSLSFFAADSQRLHDGFPRRLEYWLRTFSSLEGDKRSWQVLNQGSPQAWDASGLSTLGMVRDRLPKMTRDSHPDILLWICSPMDLAEVAEDFSKRPADSQGLPNPVFDPEAQLDGKLLKAESQVPLYAKALALFKLKAFPYGPYIEATKEQDQALLALSRLYLARITKDIAELQAAGKNPPRLGAVFLPAAETLGSSENVVPGAGKVRDLGYYESMFRGLCQEFGIPFLSVARDMRVLSLERPIVFADTHMGKDGHDLAALIAASRMVQGGPGVRWLDQFEPKKP